ncbi:MAG: 3-oxoacyl-ACP reductase family protein [Nanoarchaeota archaeon]|nr:3-oxoacyl-ACP reductase family protein [Nanoarchaeota archaeon]
MKLKNKVAIVTGSSRGIGKACALELAKQGAKIVINYAHSAKKAEQVVKKIQKLKSQAIAIQCDVTNLDDIKNLVKTTIKKFKRIDILINNAGVFIPLPISKTKEQDWDLTHKINLKGYYFMIKEVLEYMKKKKQGKIINISSIAGIIGIENSTAYCSSKGGVIALTKSLAVELAKFNINVNAICPGLIETDMTKGILTNKKTKTELVAKIPLKKVGKPEYIGKAAVFLASKDAEYITGHSLIVDGGWVIN